MDTETTPNQKPTLAGLFAFVQSKPEDEKIDNDDWDTCAVGMYLESLGIFIRPGMYLESLGIFIRPGAPLHQRFPEEYKEVGQAFINELQEYKTPDALYSSFSLFDYLALCRAGTYGRLVYVIQEALTYCPIITENTMPKLKEPKLTIEGFKAFLSFNPLDEISNNSWSSCAFGKYLKSEGITLSPFYSVSGDEFKTEGISQLDAEHAIAGFVSELKSIASTHGDDDESVYDGLNHRDYFTHQDVLDDLNAP